VRAEKRRLKNAGHVSRDRLKAVLDAFAGADLARLDVQRPEAAPQDSTETVLVFRIGSLGDTVVALPCFHHIARAFANFRRVLVTDVSGSPKVASVDKILGGSGLIDDVIHFPPPPRPVREVFALRTRIRETRARVLVYVADRDPLATLRDVLFFRLCGVRHVIGAPLASDLHRPRIDPETGHEEHEALRLARCLSSLGPVDLEDRALWDLRLRADEKRAGELALAPLAGRGFIAVSIGGKGPQKDWGDANWRQLLSLLAAEWPDLALVFFGAADEFDRSAGLAMACRGKALNICGCLTPRESAAAIKHAMLYIGHDNGPMHLAAAAGVRCVAMFGDFNVPQRWHPMGWGHRIIHDLRGVGAIPASKVHAAVCAVLAENDGARPRVYGNPLTGPVSSRVGLSSA
jgi:lipopolysaccharide heptosyltransferase III